MNKCADLQLVVDKVDSVLVGHNIPDAIAGKQQKLVLLLCKGE